MPAHFYCQMDDTKVIKIMMGLVLLHSFHVELLAKSEL